MKTVTEKFLENSLSYSDEAKTKDANFAQTVEKGLQAIRNSIKNKIGRNIDDDLEMINSFIYPNCIEFNFIVEQGMEDWRPLYEAHCMAELKQFTDITGLTISNLSE